MFAVVQHGGKQYLLQEKQKVKLEKITQAVGETVQLEEVLLVADGKATMQLGKPQVAGAKVELKVLRHAQAKKVITVKFHNKVRYRRRKGHRQQFTEVEVVKITG